MTGVVVVSARAGTGIDSAGIKGLKPEAHGPNGTRADISASWTIRTLLVAGFVILALWPNFLWAAGPSAPVQATPSAAELEQLVQTLKDDKERHTFVAQLEALIAAQRAATVNAVEPEDVVSVLSRRINALGEEVFAGVAVLVDAPFLLAWAKGQVSDQATRTRWIEVAYSLVIVFGTGLAAEWIVRRLLARVLPRAPVPSRKHIAVRVLLVLGGLVLEALPVAVFAGVALASLAMTIPPFTMARYALSG